MWVVGIFLFLYFCEMVLKLSCVPGVFIYGLGMGCVISNQQVCMLLEWLGEGGHISWYTCGVIYVYWGGGGVLYIHYVEVFFCTIHPINNLNILYEVLFNFLFYEYIINYLWWGGGLVSVYIIFSTSNNIGMISLYHKYLYSK